MIETRKAIYKGTFKNGYLLENYLFTYGQKINISDDFVNARNEREAYNKIAKKLDLPIYKKEHIEDFLNDCEFGYIKIENVNYYDEKTNEIYKYYVCIIWA